MKTFHILMMLVIGSVTSVAQQEHAEHQFHNRKPHRECSDFAQKLDSVIIYSVDPASGIENPQFVLRYHYDNELCVFIEKNSIPGNNPVSTQSFSYDSNGKITEYVYREWIEGGWKNRTRITYSYNGDLQEGEEFFRTDATGSWELYQRHFYENSDGRPVRYLRQVKNQAGEWYDFSYHNFTYDEAGNLVVLYGQYISNNLIFWRRTAYFNSDNRVFERYLEVLRYDPEVRANVLKTELHQLFSYDLYNDLSVISSETPVNGEWKETERMVYFWSLLEGRKVNVCHNGKTICVSANAVKAHLSHGDKLGSCETADHKPGKGEKERRGEKNQGDYAAIKIGIFPNPSDRDVTIRFENADHGFTGIYLLSTGGNPIDYFNAENREQVTIPVSQLKSGIYYLRFTGDNGETWKTFVRK